jgi:uncharacterized protein
MPIAARVKTGIFVVATGLAMVGLSACDSKPASSLGTASDTRQVTVLGNGQVQGTPDLLTVNVGMESIAPDVTSAMNQSSDRQKAVIDALVNSGIDRTDINTTQVSLQPQFGPDSTINGYRASNTIDVKIRDLGTASQKLALIVGTGGDATRINSVNYSIEDDSQLVKDARARAFEDAKTRAEQYAQLSDMHMGRVISISETTGTTPPPPTPMPRAAMEAVPLEPGQQTVDFTVTVVWELT